MYCKECGKEIADDSKFCSHCGAKQSDSVNDTRKEKKIILEIPEVIIKNKISKRTKIFIGFYIIYLFVILLLCVDSFPETEWAFAIFWSALPALIVLIRYILKQFKSK